MTKLLSDEQIRRQIERLRTYAAHNPSAIITEIADELQAAVLEAQGKQEPVAWIHHNGVDILHDRNIEPIRKACGAWLPLYAAPVVPEGMVMVPREPTGAMMDALWKARQDNYLTAVDVWLVLIAAAEGKK